VSGDLTLNASQNCGSGEKFFFRLRESRGWTLNLTRKLSYSVCEIVTAPIITLAMEHFSLLLRAISPLCSFRFRDVNNFLWWCHTRNKVSAICCWKVSQLSLTLCPEQYVSNSSELFNQRPKSNSSHFKLYSGIQWCLNFLLTASFNIWRCLQVLIFTYFVIHLCCRSWHSLLYVLISAQHCSGPSCPCAHSCVVNRVYNFLW